MLFMKENRQREILMEVLNFKNFISPRKKEKSPFSGKFFLALAE